MYYLLIIQNNSSVAAFAYDNIDNALAAYHNELAYRGEGREITVCTLLDEAGSIICRERWVAQPK